MIRLRLLPLLLVGLLSAGFVSCRSEQGGVTPGAEEGFGGDDGGEAGEGGDVGESGEGGESED